MRRAAHESAAAHAVTAPIAAPDEAVRQVIARLPRGATDVFVVGADGRLSGVVPIAVLADAPLAAAIGPLAAPAPACLPATIDQERVALHAVRHRLSAVPIADAAGRFAGVVPATALMAILHREHVEDLHRLAGVGRENHAAANALEEPPLRRVRHRLPWLVVGLAGSALAAWVMAAFERTLEARVAVAFFIPGVVYLADAIGTQTEAIAVRYLSLGHGPLRRVLVAEAATGLWLGLALGALAFPAIAIVLGDPRLAAAVALAIGIAATLATTIGLCLPWALARLGTDPAFGSGPIATIVQDVLSLLVYFAIVSLIAA